MWICVLLFTFLFLWIETETETWIAWIEREDKKEKELCWENSRCLMAIWNNGTILFDVNDFLTLKDMLLKCKNKHETYSSNNVKVKYILTAKIFCK